MNKGAYREEGEEKVREHVSDMSEPSLLRNVTVELIE